MNGAGAAERGVFAYHGGALGAAEKAFAQAPRPFLDLSTGINPQGYPVPYAPDEAFQRLPEVEALSALEAAAQRAFFTSASVIAGAGGHALLAALDRVLSPQVVRLFEFSYQGHARLFGARASVTEDMDALAEADLALIVNPNNPDGRVVPVARLLGLAERMAARGGVLVVDEAFMDAMDPRLSLLAGELPGNVVVLRSFGKFYGLAGLRVSFLALMPGARESEVRAALGPWPVSGPAIAIGTKAYGDEGWRLETFRKLNEHAARLDALLEQAGLHVIGGTPLFRLAAHPRAGDLFTHLAEAGLLTRPFEQKPHWLRFGLPGDDEAFARLEAALSAFA